MSYINKLIISPCPNDCYVFCQMIEQITMAGGGVEYLDIQTLNQRVLEGGLQGKVVIKASAAVAKVAVEQGFTPLEVGAALGRGNGPVVVEKVAAAGFSKPAKRGKKTVALPGQNTTAALLFTRYFEGYEPICVPFHQVAATVESGGAELGVLIHEGRFTFAQRGLKLVADLGEMWEVETQLPLPLGLIFAGPGVDPKTVEKQILESLRFAHENREKVLRFAAEMAQELDHEVLVKHVDYFVNEYTESLGRQGKAAINTLLGAEIFKP